MKDDLKTVPLFAGLADHEKEILIQDGRKRPLKPNESLFRQGDPIHNFYLICEGAVKIFRDTPDGHEMTSNILMAGDALGETEILQLSAFHPFNAMAIKHSVVAEFPVAWLKENIKRYNILALNILSLLSKRNSTATIEAEHKATMSAAQQVACFLERLCILYDFDPHGFDLPYSKTLIASRLGMELETLSRAFAKMRDHGIHIKGSRVAFEDIGKMESYVCSNCSIAGDCAEHNALKNRLLTNVSSNAI